jgi:hypothetical protein
MLRSIDRRISMMISKPLERVSEGGRGRVGEDTEEEKGGEKEAIGGKGWRLKEGEEEEEEEVETGGRGGKVGEDREEGGFVITTGMGER